MKTAFFTFGKFSPPTLGHKLMIEKMLEEAGNSDVYVVTSESVRGENAPINVKQKVDILKKMFKGTKVKVTSAKSALEFIKNIENKYNRVNMIVGQNREKKFNWIRNYTPKYGKTTGVKRPPGAISASAVRKSAREGNINKMKTMLNNLNKKMINKIYRTIREATPTPKKRTAKRPRKS